MKSILQEVKYRANAGSEGERLSRPIFELYWKAFCKRSCFSAKTILARVQSLSQEKNHC